jgi:predicted HAD superfamily Cof-like phosphohydrolase
MDVYTDIRKLHLAFRQPIAPYPTLEHSRAREIYEKLVQEEVVDELLNALKTENLAEIADGIADSIVVLMGLAFAMGIDMRPVWDAVQRSNLEKTTGPVREDGKQLKPEGWKHPDIAKLLSQQEPLVDPDCHCSDFKEGD